MKRIITAVAILGSLVLASCEVALGTMINMNGPVVKVSGPRAVADQTDIAVSDVFNLRGTAKSESKIVRMEVKMAFFNDKDLVSLSREWRWESGKWQWVEDKGKNWKSYQKSDYESFAEKIDVSIEPSAWEVAGNTVHWNLPVLMHNPLGPGDYFITISATDAAGRRDANSTVKLKVKYDNDEPTFAVEKPALKLGRYPDTMYPDYPAITDDSDNFIQFLFDSYTYDPVNDPEGTYNDIDNWFTDPLDFQWEIQKNMVGEYSLSFEFTNRHDLNNPNTGELKQLYYRFEWGGADTEVDGGVEKRGIFTDGAIPLGYVRVRPALTADEIVMRNLGTYEPDPTLGDLPKIDGKYTPIQVVSRLTDGAGNTAYKSNGWFPYFPEAKKAFALINFGTKYAADATASDVKTELKYMWTGNSDSGSYAYHKDGVQSLRWELYRLGDIGIDPIADPDPSGSTPNGSATKPFTSTVTQFENIDPKARRWAFTANKDYDIGRFKIVVFVKDIHGNEGDPQIAYFTIEDSSTPQVKELTSPPSGTLWGDANGNFNISGIAHILSPRAVGKVQIAWIKPGEQKQMADSRLLYQDKLYANWDNGTSGGWDDTINNVRVWDLGAPTSAGADGDMNLYNFTKSLNLFADNGNGLNIGPGKNPHGAQQFLIRVATSGPGTIYSSVWNNVVTTVGDLNAPQLEVTKILVTKWNGASYDPPKEYPNTGSGFGLISRIGARDRIKIEGTWSDDSYENWSGVASATRLSYLSNFNVKWSGQGEPIDLTGSGTITGTNATGGTWTTTDYEFTKDNEDAYVDIIASLTDLNNNTSPGRETLTVETLNPTLLRISSDTPDGPYGNDKDTNFLAPNSRYIDIFMEFNAPVTFFPIAGMSPPYTLPAGKMTPYLQLNNGGRAYYYSGVGDSKIIFRYFVNGVVTENLQTALADPYANKGGDSTPGTPPGRLNVSSIVWNDYSENDMVSVETGDTKAVMHEDVYDPSKNVSLAGGKNIVIDKNPPEITSIVSGASTARPHGKGSPIYITVNFNKTITVTGATTGTRADPGNFYLNLGGGNLSTRPVPAKALFDNAGAQSVSFLYTVEAGDDTSVSGTLRYLSVVSVMMGSGLSIKDLAGNEIVKPIASVPNNGSIGRNVTIDTNAPTAPGIGGTLVNGRTYYDLERTFNITGLETGSTVEYHLDYNTASPPTDGWLAAGTATGGTISGVKLDRNGIYRLAAQQSDNAVPPNVSPATATPFAVTIDADPVLTKISSTMADGVYGYKAAGQNITIDLYFRIPVILTGTPYLTLNVQGSTGTGNRANLQGGQGAAAKSIWTFVYGIPTESVYTANATPLNVNNINGGTFTVTDSAGTTINIDLSKASNLASQKNIEIRAGYPAVLTPLNTNITVSGTAISVTFDRDIFPGDTANQLVVQQTDTNYRIPTILTEAQWQAIFVNRTDIWLQAGTTTAVGVPPGWGTTNEDKAAGWEALGAVLYQKGTNGATVGTGNELVSDTTVKYVLRYDVDPGAGNNTTPAGASANMGQINNVMRAAEALRFSPRDSEVSIAANNRTMTINLNASKKLPVKGATYRWYFPNGFVKDELEKANGNNTTGYDTTITSDGTPRSINFAGTEAPVIRINKGEDIETIWGIDPIADIPNKTANPTEPTAREPAVANRQAIQPLQTYVRIDGRTPNSTFQYRTRQTKDNVGSLLWRNGAEGRAESYNEDNYRYVAAIGVASPGNLLVPTQNNGANNGTANTSGGADVNGGTGNYPGSRGTVNGIAPWALPNVGNQRGYGTGDYVSYNNAKNRPQSGNSAEPYLETGLKPVIGGAFNANWNGMNHWDPMGAWPDSYQTYNAPFRIGENNYNDGGMIVHINAQATAGGVTAQSYESAYRSVFVFNNSTINGNGNSINRPNVSAGGNTADTNTYLLNLGYDGGAVTNTSELTNPALGRMWIRGGDTTGGNASVPDFPIDRDRTKPRKARLMTPIAANAKYNSFAVAQTAEVTNGDIPAAYKQIIPRSDDTATNDTKNYPGEYLWFWVTWKINVNAYIDPFCGELPESTTAPQVPQNYKELYKGIVPSKEHYPLIPGRTTIFETRRVNRMRYGGQGGMTDFGPLLESPVKN